MCGLINYGRLKTRVSQDAVVSEHECLKTLDWMSNEGHTGVIRFVRDKGLL